MEGFTIPEKMSNILKREDKNPDVNKFSEGYSSDDYVYLKYVPTAHQ